MLTYLAIQIFSHPLFKIRLEIKQRIIILNDQYATGRVMLADLWSRVVRICPSRFFFPAIVCRYQCHVFTVGHVRVFRLIWFWSYLEPYFIFYFRLICYSLRFAFDFLFKLPVLESFALLIFEFSFSLDFGIHSKALKSLSALINYGNSTEGKEIKHRTSRVRGTLYKTIQC